MLSIGSFIGGMVGSKLSTRINETKLRLFVTIVIGATAIKLIIDALGHPS